MQSLVARTLCASGRTCPAKLLTSRIASSSPYRSFLAAPGLKTRVAVTLRTFATATTTKKTATTEKPATKRTTTKPAAKAKKPVKAAAKPKAKAVKKDASKKAVKKPVDLEEKKRLLKQELKDAALLNPPKRLPQTPWMLYISLQCKAMDGSSFRGSFADSIRKFAADFKNLSSSEKQRLEEQSEKNKAENAVAYRKWVESHSVKDILTANKARIRLNNSFDMKISPERITDLRLPKRPVNAFPKFVAERMESMPAMRHQEKMKQLAVEWKALPEAERKPYLDFAVSENQKFREEVDKLIA